MSNKSDATTAGPEPPAHAGAAPDRRRATHALWGASILGGLAQSLAGTAGALLARQLGGSDAVAGLPQALLVVGAGASALALSALTRRRGRGAALSTGAFVAVAGCIVVAIAGLSASLPGVLLGSLLSGAGNTAVMLGRYAAADLGPESARARAMASVLAATTIGAVAGPNLLAPAGALALGIGMPALVGPYLVGAIAFAAAGAALAGGLGARRAAPRTGAASVDGTVASGVGAPLDRSAVTGLVVLSVVNLVMVSVMTMAPVHLQHGGIGLAAIGLVVSLHIAGMFGPSPVSGWLTDRIGAVPAVAMAASMLVPACALVAVGSAGSSALLVVALVLLGVGWNLGLVAGSVLLTAGASALDRPRREGWGEVGMGAAAASGGAMSGVLMAAGGYPTLALAGGAVAALLLPLAGPRVAGTVRAMRRRRHPSSVRPQ